MSREFDGSGYYDWPGWQFSNSPCFAAWAILDALGTNRGVAGRYGPSNLFDTWAGLYVNSSGKIVFHVSNGGGFEATGATTVSTGDWHLIGGQYDGNDLTVWLDGTVDGTSTIGSTTLAAGGIPYVGNLEITAPWLGLLENVAYWGRGLTADEWISLYQGTSPSRLNFWDPGGNQNLRSHWPLWAEFSDEPSIASFDTLLENGSLGGADPSQRVGSPWSVAG